MPVLLYAVEVCLVSQSDAGLRSIDFTISFYELFQTNNKDIVSDCCSF